MIKQKSLILFFVIFSTWQINAQCKDCFEKDDWRFATGVTLVSNIPYAPSLQIRQPLELNLRYKFLGKQVLRLGIPFAWKTKVYGSPVYPDYPLTEIAPEEYLQNMQSASEYNFFTRTLEYYYTIYGASLGYSIDHQIFNNFTILGGIDIAYYHQFIFSKYYRIIYGELNGSYQNTLGHCGYNKLLSYNDSYSIKPLIGFCYQFRELQFEGDIGYDIVKYTNVTENKDNGWYNPGIIKNTECSVAYPSNFNKIIYSISLFYTF